MKKKHIFFFYSYQLELEDEIETTELRDVAVSSFYNVLKSNNQDHLSTVLLDLAFSVRHM